VTALAGRAADRELLRSAYVRRSSSGVARTQGDEEEVALRVQYARSLGLGEEAACEGHEDAASVLRSAFELDSVACDGDVASFIRRWLPESKAYAAAKCLSESEVVVGQWKAPAKQLMLQRLEGMSAAERKAMAEMAAARLREWEGNGGGAVREQDEQGVNAMKVDGGPITPSDATLRQVWQIDDAFSAGECDTILRAVNAAARRHGWRKDRHGKYPTTDMPLYQVPECEPMIRRLLFERVLLPLAPLYFPGTFLPEHLSFRDCFFVRYSAAQGQQRELAIHTDGSSFSFNILLNDATDFDGGGTFFEATGDTARLPRGTAVAHSGQARHGGVAITRGERYVLVGFISFETYAYSEAMAAKAADEAFCKFGEGAWCPGPRRPPHWCSRAAAGQTSTKRVDIHFCA